MVESLNSKVEALEKGTYFTSFSAYGKVLAGDKGFEFYDDRDVRNYVQIPWDEIDLVVASLVFGGKWIPRFRIQTKRDGNFIFAAQNPKRVLKVVSNHIGGEKVVRALTFSQNISRGIKGMFRKKKKG